MANTGLSQYLNIDHPPPIVAESGEGNTEEAAGNANEAHITVSNLDSGLEVESIFVSRRTNICSVSIKSHCVKFAVSSVELYRFQELLRMFDIDFFLIF